MLRPKVSIICATYNRAHVLSYAIRSVLASTFTDWELIIVGDACTDDTERIIAAFEEPRVSFENLPTNSGGQGAPNNRGLEKANGDYIFFLNHDDLYLADHIEKALQFFATTDADFIWHPVILIKDASQTTGPPDPACDDLVLDGAVGPDGYDPHVFYVASGWAMTREFAQLAGPWQLENELRMSASQDWLFRAARLGRTLKYHPRPSVICILAGQRRLSYLKTKSDEHDRVFGWINGKESNLRALLECVAVRQGEELYRRKYKRRHLNRLAQSMMNYFNLHPSEVRNIRKGFGKGAWISSIRRDTTAPQRLEAGSTIHANSPEANLYLIDGWQRTPNSSAQVSTNPASIMFTLPAGGQALDFRVKLDGKTAAVKIRTPGLEDVHQAIDGVCTVVLSLRQAAGPVRIDFEVSRGTVTLLEFELQPRT